MHTPRSPRIARLMKVAAWTFLLLFLGLAASMSLGFWGLLTEDRTVLALVPLGLAACLALALVFLPSGSACACPLCRMKVFFPSRCQRNAKARPLFGSYRLRVAGSIVATGMFRCPYCGESTRCKAREAPRPGRGVRI